ncbi:hypothetical protein HK101_002827 [Irineochytrium annulatum]|nr:hypothetical protein HK101_002827 [Irineochytrium annulatum]
MVVSGAQGPRMAQTPLPVEEGAYDGFRGIALSLQRKVRHGSEAGSGDGSHGARNQRDGGASAAAGARPSRLRKRSGSASSNKALEAEDNEEGEEEEVITFDPDSDLAIQSLNNDSGEITIIEDLSSDTILFYGRTSTTTSSAWRQSPRFAHGIMSISLSFEAAEKDTPMVDPPPCSPDLVHHLVSLYFDHFHPYFPMIHRATFTRQLKARRTEHFALLLNSMCALVAQHCHDLSAWGCTSPHDLHTAFFERARILLGRQFDWPHVNNVQALLLLCMVGQGTNINASSYHYIGIAHRQAVEMGMHRNLDNLRHPGMDDGLKEIMRTTWYCLYVLDRYISVVEGRPMAVNDDDWDTPFPTGSEVHLSNLAAHVSLCEILGRIANLVNRPTRPRWMSTTLPSNPIQDKEQTITDINTLLSTWFQTLPDHLKRGPAEGGPWSFHHHLHAMHHTALILLHRLREPSNISEEACKRSAIAIANLLASSLPTALRDPTPEGHSKRFEFVMPLVVYSALTASTLFLELMIGKKRKGSVHVREEELRRSLIAFERLKDTSLFASYYRQLIVEVLRSHGIRVEGVPELEGLEVGTAASGVAEDIEDPPAKQATPPPAPPPMTPEEELAAKLRAAAKATLAAVKASEMAATVRAARHGLPMVPSGAAVPRSSHFRTLQSGYHAQARVALGTSRQAAARPYMRVNAARQAGLGSDPYQRVPCPTSTSMLTPTTLAAALGSDQAANLSRLLNLRRRSVSAPDGSTYQQPPQPFQEHAYGPGGGSGSGSGSFPSPIMTSGFEALMTGTGGPTTASSGAGGSQTSPVGTNPPPFFADSVFSDLLNPFVDYSVWQELGAVMGGTGMGMEMPAYGGGVAEQRPN